MKKVLRVVSTAVLALGLAVGASVSASASVPGDYTTSSGAYIRATASTSSTAHGMGFPGQKATMYCVATGGTSVNGNTAWWRHRNVATGVSGYTSAELMWVTGTGTFYSAPGTTC